MIGLKNHKVATLPAKRCPHYPILDITIYTLYNNEYNSLKYMDYTLYCN